MCLLGMPAAATGACCTCAVRARGPISLGDPEGHDWECMAAAGAWTLHTVQYPHCLTVHLPQRLNSVACKYLGPLWRSSHDTSVLSCQVNLPTDAGTFDKDRLVALPAEPKPSDRYGNSRIE